MSCNTNYSLLTYRSLFEKDRPQILRNEPVDSGFRKECEQIARTQTETDDKITTLLTHWKKDKLSATQSHLNQITIDPKITQKADKIRLAITILNVASVVLAIAAVIMAVVAFYLYGGAVVENFILSLLLFPFFAAPDVVVPSAVIPCLITSGACAITGIVSYIAGCILNRSSTFREDRIQNDENFQEFINNYLEKKLGFIPSYEDLTDYELHSIFSQWEDQTKQLTSRIAYLHGKVELRHSLERAQLESTT